MPEKWWDKQTLTAASFYNNNSNMASSEKWNASMFWKCRDISEVWLSALTLVPCYLGCSPLSSLKRRKHLAYTVIQTSFHSLCVHLPQILLEGIALWIYLFYCTWSCGLWTFLLSQFCFSWQGKGTMPIVPSRAGEKVRESLRLWRDSVLCLSFKLKFVQKGWDY